MQPTLQDLCRINVRRVIRSNIYKCHPDLSKVRKRPKKPKKKPNQAMYINPMNMGMMILRQFDQDNTMSDSDDNELMPLRIRYNNSARTEDPAVNTDTDDDMDREIESENDEQRDDNTDGETEDTKNTSDNTTDSKEEQDQCKDNIQNGQAENTSDTKANQDDDESASDYGTDEEGESSKAIDEVAAANGASTDKSEQVEHVEDNLEQVLTTKIDKMKEIIANEIAACSSNGGERFLPEDIVPPDAPNLSDTDDDDESHDNVKYNVEEFIKCSSAMRSSESGRKLRYPSNTSVDTSTTSGIGSYNEEHLDAEMCRSDSEKTSPGWNHMEAETGKLCDRYQPMDFGHEEVKDECEDKDNDNDKVEEEEEGEIQDGFPRVTLSQLMQEEVHKLPLPAALKSYLLYYRC